MITYVVCDLFESPARVLVNTVNTVGVMGKGIARDFKRIYPDMFKEYQQICEKGALDIGNLWLYKTSHKWVLNFPTKKHWRQPSSPEYIEAGLRKFANTYHFHGITSISFPLLGCGNGELDWESQVQPLMEQYLDKLPVNVYIHLQHLEDPFTPEHRNIRETKKWLQGEPESLAFAEVWDDLISALQDRNHIACINRDESFQAEVDTTNEKLVLKLESEPLEVPKDAFMDLWQQVRQAGFVAGGSLPNGLDFYADYVIPLIALLPYVRPVRMANRYGDMTPDACGIQLVTRPSFQKHQEMVLQADSPQLVPQSTAVPSQLPLMADADSAGLE